MVGTPSAMTVQPLQQPLRSGPVVPGVKACGRCSQWSRSALTAWPHSGSQPNAPTFLGSYW